MPREKINPYFLLQTGARGLFISVMQWQIMNLGHQALEVVVQRKHICSFFQIQRDKVHCHCFWATFRYPFLGLFLVFFFHKTFPLTIPTPLKFQWIDSSQSLTRRFSQALDRILRVSVHSPSQERLKSWLSKALSNLISSRANPAVNWSLDRDLLRSLSS